MAENNDKDKLPWYAIPCIIIFGIPLLLYAGTWLIALFILIGIAALLSKLFN